MNLFSLYFFFFFISTTGDPTVFKNLQPPEEAVEAVVDCVRSGDFHGYAPSTGKRNQQYYIEKCVLYRDDVNTNFFLCFQTVNVLAFSQVTTWPKRQLPSTVKISTRGCQPR
jgi:hypothetical protein